MAIPHQANLSLSPGMQLLATVRLLARMEVDRATLDLTTDGDVSPSLSSEWLSKAGEWNQHAREKWQAVLMNQALTRDSDLFALHSHHSVLGLVYHFRLDCHQLSSHRGRPTDMANHTQHMKAASSPIGSLTLLLIYSATSTRSTGKE